MQEHETRWRTSPQLWDKLKPLARSKRSAPTNAEDRLWQALRGNKLGFKFRRQHVIGPFIADFYCARPVLVIEIDGSSHDGRGPEDAERQKYFEMLGTPVLRFTNDEVSESLNYVLTTIKANLTARVTLGPPSPPGGEGARG